MRERHVYEEINMIEHRQKKPQLIIHTYTRYNTRTRYIHILKVRHSSTKTGIYHIMQVYQVRVYDTIPMDEPSNNSEPKISITITVTTVINHQQQAGLLLAMPLLYRKVIISPCEIYSLGVVDACTININTHVSINATLALMLHY